MNHPVVEEVLFQFTDDWVALGMVSGLVSEARDARLHEASEPTPEEVKKETLAVVRFMLSEGLMCAGEPTNSVEDPSAFHDWPGDVADVISRIDREWESLLPFDCWFRGTPAGVTVGRMIADADGNR